MQQRRRTGKYQGQQREQTIDRPSNTQNITPDITPTAAPTAMSITRHRSDPRVAHLVAVDAVGRACGACSEACAEESWRYGCVDGRAMMKSLVDAAHRELEIAAVAR